MKHCFLLLLLIGCIASGRAESGWKAHWINTERCQSATNTWLAFRKTVHIDKVPQTLTARIAADSKYWLWINGRLVVFEGGLKRGPSPDDTYYDPVEIAPYLQNGENTIAVLVWHFGKSGFSHVNSGFNPPSKTTKRPFIHNQYLLSAAIRAVSVCGTLSI